MNYAELLRKYIEHVRDCEGSDFIVWLNSGGQRSDVVFTEEEAAELLRISDELDAKRAES